MNTWHRKLFIFALLLAFAALAGAAPLAAQGPVPQTSDAFWHGQYWNNTTLSGAPALERADNNLDFNWRRGAPDSTIGADNFSARWTRYIEVPAPGAVYRFTATADDGVRVWVGDRLLIDQWQEQSVRTFEAQLNLTPGHHLVTVEYYELRGEAVAALSYGPQSYTGIWQGEFFSNRWFSGTPSLTTGDPAIDFDWGYGGPGNLPANEFSARWTRTLAIDEVSTGPYRFVVTADDGVRLWLNGQLLISEWSDHPAQTFTADARLEPGLHELKVEYYENQGLATIRVRWEPMLQNDRWQAEYYDNRFLQGTPRLTRADAAIDFGWGLGSPATAFPPNDFSARWTRTVDFEPGVYRFTMTGDDGVRLFINDQLFMDAWYEQAERTYTDTIYLSGPTSLRMEYFEQRGLAVARLNWQRVAN